jgi:16S rRNA (uracil1498-N3)-methyltransferase
MRLTRIHIDEPLEQSSRVVLRGAASNHVRQVLRLERADEIVVFDGRGGEYAARIEEVHKDALLIAVGERRPIERESPLAVTLAQGVSRGERMDLVVQKATELGVRRIAPILTERSVVRLDAKQADAKRRHWRGVAIAACEQCGRNTVPEIALPATLAAFLSSLEPDAVRVLLSPSGGSKVSSLTPTDAPLTLLIGPEGGLSESEQRAAIDAGFRALNLGPRVLRTETAAIAALAAIQQHLGDL